MMSDEEILKYRADGIPDEIQALMMDIMTLVSKLDQKSTEDDDQLRQKLYQQLVHVKQRTEYYYKKRQQQFGIHNMRLKRLLDTFPSLFETFGFPFSHSPR